MKKGRTQGRGAKALAVACGALLTLAGCGGGGASKASDADGVVSDLLSAAVEGDGGTYCGLLTTDFLEKATGKKGDTAVTACENQVSNGTGKLPILFKVQPSQPVSGSVANVPLQATVKSGTFGLIKEDGEFKVNSTHAVKAPPSKPKPKPKPKKK